MKEPSPHLGQKTSSRVGRGRGSPASWRLQGAEAGLFRCLWGHLVLFPTFLLEGKDANPNSCAVRGDGADSGQPHAWWAGGGRLRVGGGAVNPPAPPGPQATLSAGQVPTAVWSLSQPTPGPGLWVSSPEL